MTERIEVQINYDKTPQVALAQRVPELSGNLTSIKITDQPSLNRASALIAAANDWLKAVDRIMDPVREATHKAWKASITAQDEFKAPVEKPLKVLRACAANFIAEAEQEKARKQREADEKQRKENEAKARQQAKELKELGAPKEFIQEVKAEIKATPAPVVEAVAEAAPGMSVRYLYSAEVTDLKAFLTHMISDNYLLTLFGYNAIFKKAIESELRGEATNRKDEYTIPGTRLVKTPSGTWRG